MEKEGGLIACLADCCGGYVRGESQIDGVNLALRPGRLVAVIGPNGAGKSTLLKALTGSLPWQVGRAELCGRDVASLSTRDVARLVALAQARREAVSLSVLDYVLLGRTPHRPLLSVSYSDADLRIANDAISQVGLSDRARSPVSTLSDGLRQLASVARSLAQQPKLLLLDEPIANLDPANQLRVLSVVSSATKEGGLATVVVLHDVNAALDWADDVAVMRDGRLLCFGPTRSTLTPEVLAEAYDVPFSLRMAFAPQKSVK